MTRKRLEYREPPPVVLFDERVEIVEPRRPPARRQGWAAPLALAGSHFRARERVRVMVKAAGTRRTKAVRAGRRGRFVARFPALVVDRCNADWTALATGAAGSRAAVKLPQLECPLPLGPGSP